MSSLRDYFKEKEKRQSTIKNIDYKEKDETFNVIKSKNGGNAKKDSNRRYSFDMRV